LISERQRKLDWNKGQGRLALHPWIGGKVGYGSNSPTEARFADLNLPDLFSGWGVIRAVSATFRTFPYQLLPMFRSRRDIWSYSK
jgi:hypothetical protein